MIPTKAQFFIKPNAPDAGRIAYLQRAGKGPTVVWLGGFRSDMRATKAEALDGWAEKNDRAFLRFDYSGHGESDGNFEDGTISRWRDDALAMIHAHAGPAPVLVGSSMGGWIALLAAKMLAGTAQAPSRLVLIAPAADFTEKLMYPSFSSQQKKELEDRGLITIPSAYGDPYPITRALIEDGSRNNLLDGPIVTGCPVDILQGMADPDVPWQHAMATVEHLPGDAVTMTLVKDGDHRLSRPQDIALLLATVEKAVASGH